jgi:hypothetical protein
VGGLGPTVSYVPFFQARGHVWLAVKEGVAGISLSTATLADVAGCEDQTLFCHREPVVTDNTNSGPRTLLPDGLCNALSENRRFQLYRAVGPI